MSFVMGIINSGREKLAADCLYLEPLLYAVGQGLLVVVFTDSGQNSFLVGFILITAGINLA